MSDYSSNNKRIAKNTIMLYFRMLFLMCISILTSRYVLKALGVVDYGIYNIVGGFVSMFALISASLTSACSRFINYEIGKGQSDRLKAVFSTSLIVHYSLAVIIAFLCETIGIWYLNNKMVIPTERLFAAKWCFQISILNFCTNLITVPYNAAIIAHEKMSTFAYISVFEGVAKLAICFALLNSNIDHLILYAILVFSVQLIVRTIYRIYCKKSFEECHFKLIIDKHLILQMFSYSGWHIIGNGSGILKSQGVDMIINLFFGPVLNAAKGVSNSVLNAVTGFASNFMIALNPQITQSYAKHDMSYMFSLVYRGAKLSYYLLLVFAIPLIINADYVIHLWLTDVPEHSITFVRLALICSLISTFSNTLITAQNATGNVRDYQLVVGGTQLLNLPFCYCAFKLGANPEATFIVAIVVEIISLFVRLYMIPKTIPEFNAVDFLRNVVIRCISYSVIAATIPLVLYLLTPDNFVFFSINVIISLFCTIVTVYYLGCNSAERTMINKQAKKYYVRIFKR